MNIHPDRLRAMQAQCALRRGWVHAGCPCLHYFQCRVPTEEVEREREREEQRQVRERLKRNG